MQITQNCVEKKGHNIRCEDLILDRNKVKVNEICCGPNFVVCDHCRHILVLNILKPLTNGFPFYNINNRIEDQHYEWSCNELINGKFLYCTHWGNIGNHIGQEVGIVHVKNGCNEESSHKKEGLGSLEFVGFSFTLLSRF